MGKVVPISNVRRAFHQPDYCASDGQRHHHAPDEKYQPDHQKIKHLNVAGKLRLITGRHDKPRQHRSQGGQQSTGNTYCRHQPQQAPLQPMGRLCKTRKFVQPIHPVILQASPDWCWSQAKAHTGSQALAIATVAEAEHSWYGSLGVKTCNTFNFQAAALPLQFSKSR